MDLVKENGSVRTSDLIHRFDVSLQTIRRDLLDLSEEGLVQRLHGGATLPEFTGTAYRDRATVHLEEKRQIAVAAVQFVRPGMTIAIGPGSTTEQVAIALDGMAVRVLTNSLHVAASISHPATVVSITGGTYNAAFGLTTGEWSIANAASVFADIGFIGISGVDDKSGYTVTSADEAAVLRQFIRISKRTIIVADTRKLERITKEVIAPTSAAHTFITNDAIAPRHEPIIALFERSDVELVVASARGALPQYLGRKPLSSRPPQGKRSL